MLSKLLLILVAFLVVLGVVISRQPDEFRVSRSALISVPADKVFEQVNDHHNWLKWSPWEGLDPDMRRKFSGPDSGVGAVYFWSGDKQIGEGSNTIVESSPNELIKMKLEFIRPFKAVNDVEFNFQDQGGATRVTWTMSGKANFVSKAMGLFMNCEKMVGDQFEQGLVKLKNTVEQGN